MAAAALVCACQQPTELKPSISRSGINSFTAVFPDDTRDENSFDGIIDTLAHTITVVIPYTYPAYSDSHLEMSDLTRMRVSANLDDNVSIEPALLFRDLSKENHFTLIDQLGVRKDYTVTAEIRKSSECFVTDFALIDLGLNGVINDAEGVISLVTSAEIGVRTAAVMASFGATMSPDPNEEPQDFDAGFSFTVTAQNGVDTKTYSVVKDIPPTYEFGLRPGSGKVLWQKKLGDDIGITTLNLTGGLAATSQYVVLNTRGEDLVYLDRKTGARLGTIALPFKGGVSNFYCTADENDNIFVCNLTPNDGETFKIWIIRDIDAAPEPFITYEAAGASFGRKISVRGSIDSDAIITAPVFAGTNSFARWTVKGGKLTSETPEIVTISDSDMGAWNYNCDIIYRSATDVHSDYLMANYSQINSRAAGGSTDNRSHLWMDGNSNTIKYIGRPISSNWVPNAVDYVMFNKCPYLLTNSINSFTWGADDIIYLYDLSTEDLSSVVWQCDKGIYGGFTVSGQANANSTGDVALRLSDDGFYMYAYFMFTNGYVVCQQFDCLNM